MNWAPFRASTNAQLLPIRVMEISKEMAQIKADQLMSAADKTQKMNEPQAQKAAFGKQMEEQPKS